MKWKGKLYFLSGSGSWKDVGIGWIELQNNAIVVEFDQHIEVLRGSSFVSNIAPNIKDYQQENRTLIIWKDYDQRLECAISFLSSEARQSFLDEMQGLQRESSLELPKIDDSLENIWKILLSAKSSPSKAYQTLRLLQNDDYLHLFLSFHAQTVPKNPSPLLMEVALLLVEVLCTAQVTSSSAQPVPYLLTLATKGGDYGDLLSLLSCLSWNETKGLFVEHHRFFERSIARAKTLFPQPSVHHPIIVSSFLVHLKESICSVLIDESTQTALENMILGQNRLILERFLDGSTGSSIISSLVFPELPVKRKSTSSRSRLSASEKDGPPVNLAELERRGGWESALQIISELCTMCQGQDETLTRRIVKELLRSNLIKKLNEVMSQMINRKFSSALAQKSEARSSTVSTNDRSSLKFVHFPHNNPHSSSISTPLTPPPDHKTSPLFYATDILLSLISYSSRDVIEVFQKEADQHYTTLHNIAFGILFLPPPISQQLFDILFLITTNCPSTSPVSAYIIAHIIPIVYSPLASSPIANNTVSVFPPKSTMSDRRLFDALHSPPLNVPLVSLKAMEKCPCCSSLGQSSHAKQTKRPFAPPSLRLDQFPVNHLCELGCHLLSTNFAPIISFFCDQSITHHLLTLFNTFPLSSTLTLPALRFFRSAVHLSNESPNIFFPDSKLIAAFPALSTFEPHPPFPPHSNPPLSAFIPPSISNHPAFHHTNPFSQILAPFLKHRVKDSAMLSGLLEFLTILIPQGHSSTTTQLGIRMLFVYPLHMLFCAREVRKMEMEGNQTRMDEDAKFEQEMKKKDQDWLDSLKAKEGEDVVNEYVEWRAQSAKANNTQEPATQPDTPPVSLVSLIPIIDALDWLCSDPFFVDTCDTVSDGFEDEEEEEREFEKWRALVKEGQTILMKDLKQSHQQAQLELSQQRQDDWNVFLLHRQEVRAKALVEAPSFASSTSSIRTSRVSLFPWKSSQSLRSSISSGTFRGSLGSVFTLPDSSSQLFSVSIKPHLHAKAEKPSREPRQVLDEVTLAPTDTQSLILNPAPFPHSLLSTRSVCSNTLLAFAPQPPPPRLVGEEFSKEVNSGLLGTFELISRDELEGMFNHPAVASTAPAADDNASVASVKSTGSFSSIHSLPIDAVDTGHIEPASPFSASPLTSSSSQRHPSIGRANDAITISYNPRQLDNDTHSLVVSVSTRVDASHRAERNRSMTFSHRQQTRESVASPPQAPRRPKAVPKTHHLKHVPSASRESVGSGQESFVSCEPSPSSAYLPPTSHTLPPQDFVPLSEKTE
ncbi:hypothetical protein BLNAU_3727 [Blattamonas nauphoetae]|uniref:Uncharacterized protein n=1 Tax=Blattamonas nauphoetae TaxID=2049346 RepID=A0ABQ9YC94_9EUKA|nr:hypothetical protein BLNAU_3727 [Blattamonas nauphoetae]